MRPTRNALHVLALAAMAISVPVFAQQPSDYPAPCEASKVTKADGDRAHAVFLSGKQFLEESNYDKAISYFKDAYSIDCSVHGMLPIIATAYERKGDKAEAVRALEEYVKRAPSAPDHDVIERRIKNLKDQLARDQAVATPSAPTATSTAPAATAVPSATPAPEATATTAPTAVPPPASPEAAPSEGHSVAPWVLVGLGGAVLATGVVLYAIGAGDISTADKTCPVRNACHDTNAVNNGNSGRTLVTVGGPVIGGGVAIAAAGLLWHFLEKPDHGGASTAATARISPVAAPSYAGVSLNGRF